MCYTPSPSLSRHPTRQVLSGFSNLGQKASALLDSLDANFDSMFPATAAAAAAAAQDPQAKKQPPKRKLLSEADLAAAGGSSSALAAAGFLTSPSTHAKRIRQKMLSRAGKAAAAAADQAQPAATAGNAPTTAPGHSAQQHSEAKAGGSGSVCPIGASPMVRHSVVRPSRPAQGAAVAATPGAAVSHITTTADAPGTTTASAPDSAPHTGGTDRAGVRAAAQLKLLRAQYGQLMADFQLLTTRCEELERENSQLRAASAAVDPLNDAISTQLQALLSEKAKLAQENMRLARENAGLSELLRFAAQHAQGTAVYDDGDDNQYDDDDDVMGAVGGGGGAPATGNGALPRSSGRWGGASMGAACYEGDRVAVMAQPNFDDAAETIEQGGDGGCDGAEEGEGERQAEAGDAAEGPVQRAATAEAECGAAAQAPGPQHTEVTVAGSCRGGGGCDDGEVTMAVAAEATIATNNAGDATNAGCMEDAVTSGEAAAEALPQQQ